MLTKQELAAAGLRPGELAQLTGAHPTTVSRWLNGGLAPPHYAATILQMWQMMTDDQRRTLLTGG